jgi:DnaJ family protein A protein 3
MSPVQLLIGMRLYLCEHNRTDFTSALSLFNIYNYRCPQCCGTGMETVRTGPFLMRSTCRRCHGKGFWNNHPCKGCGGAGQNKQRQNVKVPVPAGIEDGQTVRMPVGSKDIFITFDVDSSGYFRRQGADIHTDAKISLSQAGLGGAICVQGIYEDLNVQLPSATASHTRMRLVGKGIKKVGGYGYGDHYIHICIEPPKKLDEKQHALLQAFAETEINTAGTVSGFTYTKEGTKMVMEDPDVEGLIDEPSGVRKFQILLSKFLLHAKESLYNIFRRS